MGDVNKHDWHVVTKSEGGTVSILKNLSLRMAVEAAKAARPYRGPGCYFVSAGDIRDVSIIGPEGWDGCRAGWNHQREGETVSRIDSGPHEGRFSKTATCSVCGEFLHEFVDDPEAS